MYSQEKNELEKLQEQYEQLQQDYVDLELELEAAERENKYLTDDLKRKDWEIKSLKDEIEEIRYGNEYRTMLHNLPIENINHEMMVQKLYDNWDNLTLRDIESICRI